MKYLKALGFEEFLSKILAGHDALNDCEKLSVKNARGRVISEGVQSTFAVPHFRRAMRDGYAVRAQDTFGASEEHPLAFRCVEEIPAGSVAKKAIGERQCAYVATGSMLPEGTTGIVMIEFTEVAGTQVLVKQAIPPDTFIIPAGKDIPAGEVVLPEGTILTSIKLGVLAALGRKEVNVYRQPRAAVISTGNEVLSPDQELVAGKIFDINTTTLANLFREDHAIVTDYGVIPDTRQKLEEMLKQALQTHDLVVLSGGTSKGKEDLMPQILEEAAMVDLLLHGARIKPGKPILYARWGGKPVFVLPGYPTSCVATYLGFVEPLVLKLGHYPPKSARVVEAPLSTRVYSELGRQEFKAVQLRRVEGTGRLLAVPIDKGSESITTLAKADGIFVINDMQTIVEEGTIVQVHVFS